MVGWGDGWACSLGGLAVAGWVAGGVWAELSVLTWVAVSLLGGGGGTACWVRGWGAGGGRVVVAGVVLSSSLGFLGEVSASSVVSALRLRWAGGGAVVWGRWEGC